MYIDIIEWLKVDVKFFDINLNLRGFGKYVNFV